MKRRLVTKREEKRARAIVQAAMNQERAALVAANRALIGKCYRYPNHDSVSGLPWWTYAIVTSVDDHGRIDTLQIQETSDGAVALNPDAYGGLLPDGGWQEIPVHEFRAASVQIANAFLSKLLAVTR